VATVTDATDSQERVEQLLADYRRGREQLASVQRALLSIAESESSADGLVTATVGAHGELAKLVIADGAYHRYRAAELAELVTRLTGKAAARAAERANQALLPALPPDTDPAALLAGRADLKPEEIGGPEDIGAPPCRPARSGRAGRDDRYDRADEDESYEHTSWLQGTPKRGW
jgi:DNA-binding protein YbaB